MAEFPEYFIWLLGLIPLYFFWVPMIVGRQQRYPAHPKLMELNFEKLNSSLADFSCDTDKRALEIGFDEPTLVQIPHATPQVSLYLIMLVNRQNGDKAMVTALAARGILPLKRFCVEFSTRFDNDEEFNTHNISEISPFPPAPMSVRTQVPTVSDSHELYRLHNFVMGKHNARGKKVLYEPGQALDYLARIAFLKFYDEQCKRGLFYFDQEKDLYRMTFKGSYLIVWRLMQPFKTLRRMALHQRAKKILAEFHQECGSGAGSDHRI